MRDILDCHTAVLENTIEDGIKTVAKVMDCLKCLSIH